MSIRACWIFPGWKRPGLIEARGVMAQGSPNKAIFPGWKRPGLIDAASVRWMTLTWTKFPGWKRPGLIEAASASERPIFSPGISGVETPRPH